MLRKLSILGGTCILLATASVAVGDVDPDGRTSPVTVESAAHDVSVLSDPPRPVLIDVDIKPDGYPNSVNPHARGVLPVAILGSGVFDVSDIDVTTLVVGPDGASAVHNLTDSFTYNDHLRDVNLDGYMDLVTHYRVRDTGIACGDTSATLSGISAATLPCMDFIPSDPFPASLTVTAQKGPGSDCDTAVIDVIVSQVAGLYGAALGVTYPETLASFSQASIADSVLASDGVEVVMLIAQSPGELLMGITRLGPVPGIDVAGGLLVRLSFESLAAPGTADLDFMNTRLFDENAATIPGITWSGGVLTVDEITVARPIEGSDSIQTVGCHATGRPGIRMKDEDRDVTSDRDGVHLRREVMRVDAVDVFQSGYATQLDDRQVLPSSCPRPSSGATGSGQTPPWLGPPGIRGNRDLPSLRRESGVTERFRKPGLSH